ncbi:unnamed protein product [Parnassius apollo]|uniref:(apollo) hypothetical protein n=1 Tax=Parnassius apollo TaxID=110799 RepID=A0A8S3X8M1_PARAO|nr:unnamed protein product [Parnassius apollo]
MKAITPRRENLDVHESAANAVFTEELFLMNIDFRFFQNLQNLKQRLPSYKVIVQETCDRPIQTVSDSIKDAETVYSLTDFAKTVKVEMEMLKNGVINGSVISNYMLRRSQSCNTTVSFKNFYKYRLRHGILQWLREIPIESDINSTAKILTESIINNLIEKINKLSVEANCDDYEMKLKSLIEYCLNSLPSLYHSAKCDKMKHILLESLMTRIMVLNEKYLNLSIDNIFQHKNFNILENSFSNTVINGTTLTKMIKAEISNWLRSKQFKRHCGTPINTNHVTMMLMNQLLPFLYDKETKAFKYLIRGGILEVLERLSLTFDLSNNRIRLNGLASELTNKLLNTRKYYEQSIKNGNIYSDLSKTELLSKPKNMHLIVQNM